MGAATKRSTAVSTALERTPGGAVGSVLGVVLERAPGARLDASSSPGGGCSGQVASGQVASGDAVREASSMRCDVMWDPDVMWDLVSREGLQSGEAFCAL